jgi:hypothetical protein
MFEPTKELIELWLVAVGAMVLISGVETPQGGRAASGEWGVGKKWSELSALHI